MTDSEWGTVPDPTPYDGTEPFLGIDATVADFWRFAMSDLRTNNVRGYLAEFLVARAVGSTTRRIEWDAYDVLTPEGIRVEVKSAGYLQVWAQRGPSKITFGSLRGKTWSPEAGYADEQSYNADVYAFCVQAAMDHGAYDPLDVSQWEFYVLPARVVSATGGSSMGLARVKSLTDAVEYAALGEAIRAAAVNEA